MKVGVMPSVGLLYDESLKGKSAEEIYDMMISDMRKYKKLATFRGYGKGDVMRGGGRSMVNGVSLDEFYRNALAQGLEYHTSEMRGFVTIVSPSDLACAAISISFPPIGVPAFSSAALMSPYSMAALSSNGSMSILERKVLSAVWFLSGKLLFATPSWL